MRIATFVIAATLAAAAPWQSRQKSKTVAIPLTKRSSSTLLHPDNNSAAVADSASVSAKIVRGLDNYEKNTGTTHPFALERTGRDLDNGGFALKKYNNLFWYCTLSIGSPPKEFDVELDTGSADLFVLADGGDAITLDDTIWDPTLSDTANDLNLPFNIMFANGDIALGTQYTDNVSMAGFTADKQTIGAATKFIFMETSAPPVEGILGLGFQSISTFPASPLFETLVNENKVTDPVFSFQLTSSGGELFIGGTNEGLYQKDTLTYTDGYWQVKMDEIRGNDRSIASEVDVVIDTGANYIYGDEIKVSNLHMALGGKAIKHGYYSLPCKADPEPSVTLKFGSRPFKIPIEMLRLGPISEGSSDCFSTIVANSAPVSFWNIGAPFLQGVYTVFDYGTQPIPRVGFAELA